MTAQTEITAFLKRTAATARTSVEARSNPAQIKAQLDYVRAEIQGLQLLVKARNGMIRAAKQAKKDTAALDKAQMRAKKELASYQGRAADLQKRLANPTPTPVAPGKPAPAPAAQAPATNVVASIRDPLVPVLAKKKVMRGATVSGKKEDGTYHVHITPSRLTHAGAKKIYDWHKAKGLPSLVIHVAGRERPHTLSTSRYLAELLQNLTSRSKGEAHEKA